MSIRRLNNNMAYNDELQRLYLKCPYHHVSSFYGDSEESLGRLSPYGGEIEKFDLYLSNNTAQLRAPRGIIPFSLYESADDSVFIEANEKTNKIYLGNGFAYQGLSVKEGLILFLRYGKRESAGFLDIARTLNNVAQRAKISNYPSVDIENEKNILKKHGLADGMLLTEEQMRLLYSNEWQKKGLEPKWFEPIPDLTGLNSDDAIHEFFEEISASLLARFVATYKTNSLEYFDSLGNGRDEDVRFYISSIVTADNRARKLGEEFIIPRDEESISLFRVYQWALQKQEGMPTEFDCAECLDWFTPEHDAAAVCLMMEEGFDEKSCREIVKQYSPGVALAGIQNQESITSHDRNAAKYTEKYLTDLMNYLEKM